MFKKEEDKAVYYGKNKIVKLDEGVLKIKFIDEWFEWDEYFYEKFMRSNPDIEDLEFSKLLVEEDFTTNEEELFISRFNKLCQLKQ